MRNRLLSLILLASLVAVLAGCGSDSSSSTGSTNGGTSTAALLNGWSDATLATLALQADVAKAIKARDKGAYDEANNKLQADLKKIAAFPDEAESALGSDAGSTTGKAVTADANAWKAWAEQMQKTDLNAQERQKLSQLGVAAVKAHLAAYKAAGVQVPADFKKQAGGS